MSALVLASLSTAVIIFAMERQECEIHGLKNRSMYVEKVDLYCSEIHSGPHIMIS